jgi:hypothetical protein
MNIVGNIKPLADRWWLNSTPEMSPNWISTSRHEADEDVAAGMNSSPEP